MGQLARTSIDGITAAAHVAKGTFYAHFRRRPDLAKAVGLGLGGAEPRG